MNLLARAMKYFTFDSASQLFLRKNRAAACPRVGERKQVKEIVSTNQKYRRTGKVFDNSPAFQGLSLPTFF
jgi:hypothetical protein